MLTGIICVNADSVSPCRKFRIIKSLLILDINDSDKDKDKAIVPHAWLIIRVVFVFSLFLQTLDRRQT